MFDNSQRQYLIAQCSEPAVFAVETILKTGGLAQLATAMSLLSKLSPQDKAAVEADLRAKLAAVPAAPQGYPGSNGGAVTVAPQAPNLLAQISAILTRTDKAGNVVGGVKGLAKYYQEDLTRWPTVDAFGRPFPTLTQLVAVPKTDARQYFTGSGWARCTMDGLMYYQHDQAGADMFTIMAAQEAAIKAAPAGQAPPVIGRRDPSLPVTITAYSWRHWNGANGEAQRHTRPDQHEALCKYRGLYPAEYMALKAQQQAAATAPTQPAPSRRSRSRKA